MFGTGFHDQIKDIALIFRRHPDFIAQIAGETDTAENDRRHPQFYFPHIHESQSFIGDIFMGDFGEHVTGVGPGNRQTR